MTEIFSYLVTNGHAYHDVLWTYPIDLVYNFYHTAIANEQRSMAYLGSLARVASYSARDLTKEGSKKIEEIWSDLLKPLSSSGKRGNAKNQNQSMSTGNKAADGLFSTGQFKAVKMAVKPDGTGA